MFWLNFRPTKVSLPCTPGMEVCGQATAEAWPRRTPSSVKTQGLTYPVPFLSFALSTPGAIIPDGTRLRGYREETQSRFLKLGVTRPRNGEKTYQATTDRPTGGEAQPEFRVCHSNLSPSQRWSGEGYQGMALALMFTLRRMNQCAQLALRRAKQAHWFFLIRARVFCFFSSRHRTWSGTGRA